MLGREIGVVVDAAGTRLCAGTRLKLDSQGIRQWIVANRLELAGFNWSEGDCWVFFIVCHDLTFSS